MTANLPRVITPAGLGEIVLGREMVNGRYEPKYKRHAFVRLLNAELLALASGEIDRLAVFAPPRHSKTLTLNVLFGAWFLGLNPDKQVIVASHSATLASKFGMQVRDILEEFGGGRLFAATVRPDRRAVDNWALTDGGGMLSIGVGGSLVGHGADLLIFDDIIADSQAALSPTIRNNTVDWYESTAETRLNAGGKVVFTMQRWHDDDPAGRIVLADRDRWRIITLPAIAEENDILGRQPGEALWPEKWPIDYLRELERRKPFWFAAQYQQRPVPRGGGMIQRDWIEQNAVFDTLRDADGRVRWWDLAATQGGGDYTVGVLMSRKNEVFHVEDVVRGQWGATERDRVIRTTCERDNRQFKNGVMTWFEQEPGSSGKVVGDLMVQKMAPFAARCETSTGKKEIRAEGMASAFGRGEIRVRKGSPDVEKYAWYEDYVSELTSFPYAKHDDAVDATSGGYNKLALELSPGGCATLSADEWAREEAEVWA